VTLPGYRVLDRAVARRRGPAIVARLQVDVPLQEISGIGDKRAAELTRLRIPNLAALAKADVATASSLPGVSDRMAEEFIAEAAKSSANAVDG
jgi:predicted flap endonuclease-1-like 5' DNA nuclease